MWRAICLTSSLALVACSVSFTPPENVVITCSANADCPGDLVCVVDAQRCTEPGSACVEQNGGVYQAAADGNACSLIDGSSGVCKSGLCTLCGNGAQEAGEECDDANLDEQDGCTSLCQIALCGDGVTTPLAETCDDRNDNPNDFCDACQQTSWMSTVAFGLGPRRTPLNSTTLPGMTAITVSARGVTYVASVQPAGERLAGTIWRLSESANALIRIAGNGTGRGQQLHGEADVALFSPLGNISGLTSDGAGNIYFTESEANTKGEMSPYVMRLDPNGVLHIVAGDGTACDVSGAGNCGNGGLARTARFKAPRALTFDRTGRLVIADASSVRAIDSDGFIARVAGNYETCTVDGCGDGADPKLARFYATITGIAVSDDNTMFVTACTAQSPETCRGSTLDIVPQPRGQIRRINGSGIATLDENMVEAPTSVTVIDSSAIAYTSDTALLTMDVKSPTAKTIATGEFFSALEVNANGNVLVVDSASRTVELINLSNASRRVVLGSAQPTDILDGTRGTAITPNTRALSSWGNDLLFSTGQQLFVWRASSQLVELVAGVICPRCPYEGAVRSVRFSDLRDIAVVGDVIYVVDAGTVRRITGGMVTTIAGSGLQSCTVAAPCDDTITSAANARNVTFLALNGLDATSTELYVTSATSLWRIDLATGGATRASNALACANDVAIDGADVYVADTGRCLVERLRGGSLTTLINLTSDCTPVAPSTPCDAYDACTGTRPFQVATRMVGSVKTLVYADCDKVLSAPADSGAPSATVAGGGTEVADLVPPTQARLTRPGFAVSAATFIYERGERVRTSNGQLVTVIGNVDVSTSGTFDKTELGGIAQVTAFGPSSAIMVDAALGVLRRVDFDAAVVDPVLGYIAGRAASGTPTPARYVLPVRNTRGVAYANGVLYTSTRDSYLVTRIEGDDPAQWPTTLVTSARTPAAGAQGSEPDDTARLGGLALDAKGETLYAVDTTNNVVRAITVADNTARIIAGRVGFVGDEDAADGPDATFNTPQGIAVAPDGGIYIADQGNNRVRRIEPGGRNAVTTVFGNGASATTDDDRARRASVDSPTGLAFDAFGNLVVAGRDKVRVVASGCEADSAAPSANCATYTLYNAESYAEQVDLATCLSAPFFSGATDVVYVGDACSGVVLKLQRQ